MPLKFSTLMRAILAGGGSPFNPVISNVRLSSLVSMTESGSAGAGWTYTSTVGGGAGRGGNADKSIPLGTDGSITATLATITNLDLLGLDDVNAAQGFSSYSYGIYPDSGGTKYSVVINGTGSGTPNVWALVPQVGDKIRLRVCGNQVVAEVYPVGGSAWRLMHVFAAAPSATLYPQANPVSIGGSVGALQMSVGQSQARWSNAAVNVVFDGNSWFAGGGASQVTRYWPNQISNRAPMLGSGCTMSNLGISAQTIAMMNGQSGGSAADVDAAYVGGKFNVLVVCEGTNSIWLSGRTGLQAASDMTAYITARKLANPWQKVVLINTLPREGTATDQAQRNSLNAEIDVYNAYLAANYKAMGADYFVNVRQPGSPFNITSYTPADFDSCGAVWSEVSPGRIHPNDAGYSVLADYVSQVLTQIVA